jgi:hypothetical protein
MEAAKAHHIAFADASRAALGFGAGPLGVFALASR